MSLHFLGDCNVVGVFSRFVFSLLLSWKNFSSEFATFHLVYADRRRWQKGDRPDNDLRWAMQHSDKKKWEATFSLVRVIIFREGSTVISPEMIAAAALVLPPKTPLIGQSVLFQGQKESWQRCRKWPSLLYTSSRSDLLTCSSSSVTFWGSTFPSISRINRRVAWKSLCPVVGGGSRYRRTVHHIQDIIFQLASDWIFQTLPRYEFLLSNRAPGHSTKPDSSD